MDGEEKFRKLLSDIDSNINKVNKCSNQNIKKIRKDYTELKFINVEGLPQWWNCLVPHHQSLLHCGFWWLCAI